MVEKHERNSTCTSSLPAISDDGRRKQVFFQTTNPRESVGGCKSFDAKPVASRAFQYLEDDNSFIEINLLPSPFHGAQQARGNLYATESYRSLPLTHTDGTSRKRGTRNSERLLSSRPGHISLRASKSLDIDNLPRASNPDRSEKFATRPSGLSSSAGTDDSQRSSPNYLHEYKDGKSYHGLPEKNTTRKLGSSQCSVFKKPDLIIAKRPKPAMEDIMSSLLFSAKMTSNNQLGIKQTDMLRNDVYFVLANLDGRAHVRKTETGLEIMAGRKKAQRPMEEHATTFSQARVRDWVDNQRSLLQKSLLPGTVR